MPRRLQTLCFAKTARISKATRVFRSNKIPPSSKRRESHLLETSAALSSGLATSVMFPRSVLSIPLSSIDFILILTKFGMLLRRLETHRVSPVASLQRPQSAVPSRLHHCPNSASTTLDPIDLAFCFDAVHLNSNWSFWFTRSLIVGTHPLS